MKRRALLAVLLVVALGALALLRSEVPNRQKAEVALGSPLTGNPGVTRSISWIRERQRYLDGHPEVVRQKAGAAREAAAAETAREEAAGEKDTGRAPDTNIREKPEPGDEG